MKSSAALLEQSYRNLCDANGNLPKAVVAFCAEPADVDNITINGTRVPVVFAHSELGLRRALRQMDGGPGIVLTALRNRTTSHDVLARLHERRIDDLDVTHAALARHGFRDGDPTLRTSLGRRVGERLLRLPVGRLAGANASGVLSWHEATRAVIADALGLGESELTLSALLQRCLADGLDTALQELDRADLGDVLDQVLGNALAPGEATAARHLLERAREPGSQPLGWAGALVAAHRAAQVPEHTRSALRALGALAPGLGDAETHAAAAALDAALSTYRLAESRAHAARLGKLTDAALEAVGALPLAVYAPQSQAGEAARWRAFGHALDGVAQAASSGTPEQTHTAVQRVWDALDHLDARDAAMDSARAAARLAAWLATPDAPCDARSYVEQQSQLDADRDELIAAQLGPAHESTQRLLAAVQARVNTNNAQFAAQVLDAMATGQAPAGAVLIHQALSRWVAPLAAKSNVLLVVLDGMSWAVLWHLLADIERREPGEVRAWVPALGGQTAPVLALVPSITNLSRHALLTGRPTWGDAASEKKGFGALWAGREAVLYHKAELHDGGTVHDAVHSKVPVVGVVINAVDDGLDGPTQAALRWTLDTLPVVRALLGAASEAGRTVVLASDHGHVLDRTAGLTPGLRAQRGDDEETDRRGGARWRTATTPPGAGEHLARAPWLQPALGVDSVVVPSADDVRYGQRARGYHGGISRAELVAPLVVLHRTHEHAGARVLESAGWIALNDTPPVWMSRPVGAAPAAALATQSSPLRDTAAPQSSLPRDTVAVQPSPLRNTAATQNPRWAMQRKRPACSQDALPDVTALTLIEATLGSGGKLATAQAATLLGMAPRRVPALFDALCELLNIDGTLIAWHERGEGLLRIDAARFVRDWG